MYCLERPGGSRPGSDGSWSPSRCCDTRSLKSFVHPVDPPGQSPTKGIDFGDNDGSGWICIPKMLYRRRTFEYPDRENRIHSSFAFWQQWRRPKRQAARAAPPVMQRLPAPACVFRRKEKSWLGACWNAIAGQLSVTEQQKPFLSSVGGQRRQSSGRYLNEPSNGSFDRCRNLPAEARA